MNCKGALYENSDIKVDFEKLENTFLVIFLEYNEKSSSNQEELRKIYENINFSFPFDISENMKKKKKNPNYYLMGMGCDRSDGFSMFFRNDENIWVSCNEKRRKEYKWEEIIKENYDLKGKPMVLIYF